MPEPIHAGLACIVVLNWNGYADTVACVNSLHRLTYPNIKIVVVDNASQDGSEARLRVEFPEITVIQAGANLGYAGGNNLGISWALEQGADYVWILNNDTVVDPHSLSELISKINSDPTYALCGSLLIYDFDHDRVQACAGASYNLLTGTAKNIAEGISPNKLPTVDEVERRLDYVIGASMLASRSFIEQAGPLDEGYFLYFEELDWAARLPVGHRLGFAPRSIVYHKDGATIGKNHHSRNMPSWKRYRNEYYLLRARWRYMHKHYPLLLPSIVVATMLTIGSRLMRGQLLRAALTVRAVIALLTGRDRPRQGQEMNP